MVIRLCEYRGYGTRKADLYVGGGFFPFAAALQRRYQVSLQEIPKGVL